MTYPGLNGKNVVTAILFYIQLQQFYVQPFDINILYAPN